MPRSAGTYTLPVPPFNAGDVISAANNNSNFSDIATALTGSVPRDGTGAMQAALPMGNNKITGLANATAATDAAAYGQLGEVKIAQTVISGTPTTVDFALPSGFTSFRLLGTTIFSASGGFQLSLRISTNSGASYDAGATDYQTAYSFQSNTLNSGALSTSSLLLTDSGPANNPHNFVASIVPGDGAFGLRAFGTATGTNGAGTFFYSGTFGGARSSTGRATNIRVLGSAAMANTGVITLFGVV